MSPLRLSLLIFCFSASLYSFPASKPPKPIRIVTKLIYRHSVDSPFFNPNTTMEERSMENLKSSIERIAYLKLSSSSMLLTKNIWSRVVPGGPPLFLVDLLIGSRHTEQLVVLDTGSSLLWVHCNPCVDCDHLKLPLYDPAQSATNFANIDCHSSYCTSLPYNRCGKHLECIYQIRYMSAYSDGTLATEQFTTTSGDILTNVVFGCSNRADIYGARMDFNGILGLGNGASSLMSQKGYTSFSYCLGFLYNERNIRNKLIIGEPLIRSNNTTPLFIDKLNNHYHVILEGISVAGEVENIGLKDSRRHYTFDITLSIVDTGSIYSYLQSVMHKELREDVIRLLSATNLVRSDYTDEKNILDLCYRGIMAMDLRDFPTIIFHFRGGAKMELSFDNLFHQFTPDVFCLSVLSSEKRKLAYNLIGANLQQFFYIAYELTTKGAITTGRLSFERVDCKDI